MIDALGLSKFFGVESLNEVNSLFLPMLSDYKDDPYAPGWLEGISSLTKLPRFVAPGSESLPFFQTVDFLAQKKIAHRMRWIVDVLNNPWSFDEDGFYLLTAGDQAQYRLRWSLDV